MPSHRQAATRSSVQMAGFCRTGRASRTCASGLARPDDSGVKCLSPVAADEQRLAAVTDNAAASRPGGGVRRAQ